MKFPVAGEMFRGFCIAEWNVGEVMVRLSPGGIEYYLGSKGFSICNRHIGPISLGIVYLDKIECGDPVTVRCDNDEEIWGNVLIFGFNGSLKPLEDFEIQAIKSNLTLEKKGGNCTVVLNNVVYKENKALEDTMNLIEQASNEKHQNVRP